MKYQLVLLAGVIATAGIAVYVAQSDESTGDTATISELPRPVTTDSVASPPSSPISQPTDTSNVTQRITTVHNANNTEDNSSISLCETPADKTCMLRADIDLSRAFSASATELNGKPIWQALTSNNYEQLHQLLEQANVSAEALQRQADYQAMFNEFYQYAPGLLTSRVTCSDEICATSFAVQDADSAKQVSQAMEKFTADLNAHSFSTVGRNNDENLEVKIIFSNSTAFESVLH